MAAGISADHEITSGDDALEKLRAGLTVEIRGSHDYLLPDVVKAINSLPVVPASVTVCTDDVFPDHLIEKARERRAAAADPLRPRPAAGDPLRHHQQCDPAAPRRSGLGGGWAAADLAVLATARGRGRDRLRGGRRVAANGRLLEAAAPRSRRRQQIHEARAARHRRFSRAGAGVTAGRAPADDQGRPLNSWSELEVEVRDGFVVVPENVSVMTVAHRHGRSDLAPQTAIIEDWDRWRGAYAARTRTTPTIWLRTATTWKKWRSPPYRDRDGRRHRRGEGRPRHRPHRYPVAGLLSDKEPAEVAGAHRRVVEAAGEICTLAAALSEFKALEGQSLACNPGPHLTDQGMTDAGPRNPGSGHQWWLDRRVGA